MCTRCAQCHRAHDRADSLTRALVLIFVCVFSRRPQRSLLPRRRYVRRLNLQQTGLWLARCRASHCAHSLLVSLALSLVSVRKEGMFAAFRLTLQLTVRRLTRSCPALHPTHFLLLCSLHPLQSPSAKKSSTKKTSTKKSPKATKVQAHAHAGIRSAVNG